MSKHQASTQKTPSTDQLLPHLPTELIEAIFSSVDDVQTLATICTVSKLGKRTATPLLYRSLGVTIEKCYNTEEREWRQEQILRVARSLQLQCRTLLENRELAKNVVELHQYMNGNVSLSHHGMGIVQPEECRQVLSRDINLPRLVVDTIIRGLIGDEPDAETDEAYFMLLMSLCPNVTTLRLEGELGVLRALPQLNEVLTAAFVEWPRGLKNTAPTPASGLYTIREIYLTSSGEGDALGAEDMACLLRVPGLVKILADVVHPSVSQGAQSEADYWNSSVKTVEIQSCFAKDEDLEALFVACPNVESLSITWAMREDNYRRFDWSEIGFCIKENMTELKHLTFDHHPDLDPWLPDADFMFEMMGDDFLKSAHLPGLGTLKQLRNLETLSLSRIALFGTHNDDEHNFHAEWNDDEEGLSIEKHTLDTLLPGSLKELTSK